MHKFIANFYERKEIETKLTFVSPFKYYTRQLSLRESSNYTILVLNLLDIRLPEKFLSFYGEIIDTQRFLFYIILSNFVRAILFC